MQVTVSTANMWVTIFIVIMQMRVPVAIMQVVFSAVQYAHDCFYCNYAGQSFFYSLQVTVSGNFLFHAFVETSWVSRKGESLKRGGGL